LATLRSAGLLVRDGRKLSVPWDELQANVSLVVACGASKPLLCPVFRHQICLQTKTYMREQLLIQ
jgi:hypothetical protein